MCQIRGGADETTKRSGILGVKTCTIPSGSSDCSTAQKGGAQPGSQWHLLSWLQTCQRSHAQSCHGVGSAVSQSVGRWADFLPRGYCIWQSSCLSRMFLCFWCLDTVDCSTPEIQCEDTEAGRHRGLLMLTANSDISGFLTMLWPHLVPVGTIPRSVG